MTIIFLASLFLVLSSFSQPDTEWTRATGGLQDDRGYCIIENPDGSLMIAGNSASFSTGDDDGWLLVLRSGGRVDWQKTYGGTADDSFNAIIITPDDNYMLIGETSSSGSGGSDIWVIKIDSSGSEIWERTYGGNLDDVATSATVSEDGGVMIAGYTWSEGSGGSDAMLLKINMNGDPEWIRTFGGTEVEQVLSVSATSDSGAILSGMTYSWGSGSGDVFLLKADAWGREEWRLVLGGTDYDYGYDIIEVEDGDFLVASWKRRATCSIWLIRINSAGEMIWDRVYSTGRNDRVYSIAAIPEGGWILAGSTETDAFSDIDFYVCRINPEGELLWDQTFGGVETDKATDVIITENGDILLTGYTASFGSGGDDSWTIRLKNH